MIHFISIRLTNMTELTIFCLRKKLLPDDVIRHIFSFIPSNNDYYEEMQNYFQLLNIVRSNEYSIIYKKLYDLVFKNILENAKLLNYVLSKNDIFRRIYDEHIINNNKRFKLMNINNSFLHSIIMTIHH